MDVLCLIVRLYSYVLLVRVVFSFIPMFNPNWRPPDWIRPMVDFVYAITEPPIQFLRRIIPQPQGVPLDLAFLVFAIFIGSILPRLICS